MRIIAGKYGGRIIESPKKHATHPMSEKMRGAIFNALGDIVDLKVFDAYAGSGAIGIEALSRGAKYVLFTDKDRQAVATIQGNLDVLGIDKKNYDISEANCVSYINNQPQTFDIIIADPPYEAVKQTQLNELANYLKPDGIFILSAPPEYKAIFESELKIIKQKTYGDASIAFLRTL